MPAPKRNDDDERALRVLREMIAMGVVPRSITVGAVEIQVHSLDRSTEGQAKAEPHMSSYLEQRLLEQRLERMKSQGGRS